jgi:hypothetical protein
MGRLVLAIALLDIGCSSTSLSLTCCLQFQQSSTSWSCPNEAASDQCCGGDVDASGCGPDATPANACTGGTVTSC